MLSMALSRYAFYGSDGCFVSEALYEFIHVEVQLHFIPTTHRPLALALALALHPSFFLSVSLPTHCTQTCLLIID